VIRSGLVAGDRVVIEGTARIFYPGQPIQPQPPKPATPATNGEPTAALAQPAGEH
jgi:membrane fusion protein (multidrug efflux system)